VLPAAHVLAALVVEETRSAQGLPRYVEDPIAVETVAALMRRYGGNTAEATAA
jgi:hypothetical protein